MLSFTKSIALLSLVLSVSALAGPHAIRNVHHNHRHIVATPPPPPPAVDDALPPPPPSAQRSMRRKRSGKRCIPKSPSQTPTVHGALNTPASTPTPTSTAASSSVPEVKKVQEPATTTTTTNEKTHTDDVPLPTPNHAAPPPDPTHADAAPKKHSPPPPPEKPEDNVDDKSGGSGGTHSGDGTYYATGLGACGITNRDSDHIVAVSKLMFDSYPGYKGGNSNHNPICNKRVIAYRNGKSVTCTITDRCEGCKMNDLDFSPSAFNQLASPSEGRVRISWKWA